MTCLVSITWEMGDHTTAADDVFGIDHVGNGRSYDCRL